MSTKALWAPWRMEFLTSPRDPNQGCIFCDFPKEKNDRDNLIVGRKKNVFIMLNKYPYNNGHLMIIPYQHCSDLTELKADAATEMMGVAQESVAILQKAYQPEGFNLGMNIGASGGAGIRDHLHLHIVPRWIGDTNFMPVIAETKTMPQHLMACYDLLKKHF